MAKANEGAQSAKTRPYKVVRNLRHNGKGYAPESTVELSEEHAAPLLKSGVVAVPEPKVKPEEAK